MGFSIKSIQLNIIHLKITLAQKNCFILQHCHSFVILPIQWTGFANLPSSSFVEGVQQAGLENDKVFHKKKLNEMTLFMKNTFVHYQDKLWWKVWLTSQKFMLW